MAPRHARSRAERRDCAPDARRWTITYRDLRALTHALAESGVPAEAGQDRLARQGLEDGARGRSR
jgi:hypothetical protein